MEYEMISMDRREWLGAAAAFSVVGAVGATDASAATATDAGLMYRKMHFRSDDGLVFWWLQGVKYGQVGTTLTPLYTASIGTLQRVKHVVDGGFEVTQLEMNVILDLQTGRALDAWRNPYTNEVLPVRMSPVGPTVTRYGADNVRVLPKEIGSTPLEATATLHPPLIVGDDVFQRDESVARVFTPGRDKPFEVNDIAVYHGSLANLSDPRVKVGEATVFFAEVTGWQRWMNMGDRPGGLTSRMVGRKVRRYEDLPADWRANLARAAPHVAADPIAALDAAAAKFDR
ncbi:MAG: DUF1838 domain-containing protein [Gammaproteobacteria bacterium]|nr:DUF1838 domain-containing protein [Gammaproteobacteria bacterium]